MNLIESSMTNNCPHSDREIFHGGPIMPREGYILVTGIATSAIFPLLVLSLATIL